MSLAQRAALERINALNDSRECEPDSVPVLILADGTEKPLPTTWVVCTVCRGAGSHVNPSIDCGGLSSEDFDQDPDFAESYAAGAYDVTCAKCQGRTTVRAVDLDALSDEDRKAYEEQLEDDADYDAMCRAEIRAGA